MDTIIEYTDIDNMPITVEHSKQLFEFKKHYFVNHVIKIIEIYVDNRLDEIQYFKAEDENTNDIFLKLGTNSVTIITLKKYGRYMVKSVFNYINGINGSVKKNLLEDNKIICNLEFDTSGNIDVTFSAKYMYDANGFEIGEEIFSFHYNTDGTINYISGICYPFSEHNPFLEASEIQTYFPNLLLDNPYYFNLTFLPLI